MKKVGGLFVALFASIFMVANVSAEEVTDSASLVSCLTGGTETECVLGSNITISSQLELTHDLVLDLNGYTLTSTYSTANKGHIITAHKLTIKDSKGTGKFDASNTNGYAFYAVDGGTLVLESGKIISTYAPFSGNNTTGDMNFIVNGGTLEAEAGAAIYMPGQVTLEINDGTLIGGINLRMGQITINGGTIINNNSVNIDTIEEYYYYNGNIFFSDAVAIIGGTYNSSNEQYGNSLNLVINGGTFESEIGNALTIYALGKIEQELNVTINGGTFNGKEISVAVETPETLELTGTKVTEYSKVSNTVNTNITAGTYNSDVTDLVSDGYKVIASNGTYTIEPNLVIATDDENVTIESEEVISNDYRLVVEEEKLTDEVAIQTSAEEKINALLKDEEILDSKLVATYDISVKDSNDQVVKLDNGNYTISIKLTDEQVGNYTAFKVLYINDNGEIAEVLDATLTDGVLSFETSHLSTYSIVGYNTVTLSNEDNTGTVGDSTTTPEETPSVPQTFDNVVTYVVVGALSIASIIGATLYIKKKQTKRA